MDLLRVLTEIAIVGWLPGAVIFRLPWLDRDKRAALAAEERAFWAVILSLAVSLSIVLALAALHRYSLARLLIANLSVSGLCAAVARGRLRLGPAAVPISPAAVVPLILIVLGVARFFPPAEYIIGGKDPGVYLNEGVQIAQRGAIVVHDPVIAAVPDFARDLFFPSHQRSDYYSLRFMGFWIQDPDTGAVIGQFPHLFPASIAIAYGVWGLTGARAAVSIWAILGVLAVYFAAARLVGRAAAAATGVLLTLHVIEVWFGRYPNAEVVMQALLFAALLANARSHVDRDSFFAPVAGLLLGLLLFLRYDTILGIAGVSLGLVLSIIAGRSRPHWSFLAVFGVAAAMAAAYLFGPMRAYMNLPIVFLSNLPGWEYAALGVALAAATAGVALVARVRVISQFTDAWVPALVVASVWLLAFYALLLRHQAGKLAAHDADALRTFTYWYLTLPALLAALIGFALVVRRTFWRDPALILSVAIFACIFFFKIRIVPEHFWMTRRFLAVILPGSLMFACAAALSGARARRGTGVATPRIEGPSVGRAVIGIVFVALLASGYARASRPITQHVEYAGLIPRLEALARNIGDDDLVIAESRDTGSDVHVMALPLAYIYGRNVLVLYQARPDKAALARFLGQARTRYQRVLFLGGGGTDLLSHRYGVRPIASERFQVPEYDAPVNAFPRFVREKEFEYGLYEFTAAEPLDRDARFDLDIGLGDDLHVVRFHAKEVSEGRTFRWTGGTSYISVTHLQPSNHEVTLWLNDGGRPPAAGSAKITVFLQGQMLGSAVVEGGFRPYAFAIPPDLAARAAEGDDPAELRLVTSTWNPHQVLGTGDDRTLGVMVDRVAVR
ncbi:MAG: hypothetical protein ACJ731_06640 [Vicinamibacterales bacterium]